MKERENENRKHLTGLINVQMIILQAISFYSRFSFNDLRFGVFSNFISAIKFESRK